MAPLAKDESEVESCVNYLQSTGKDDPARAVNLVERQGDGLLQDTAEQGIGDNFQVVEALPHLIEVPALESKAAGAIRWDHFRSYFLAFGRWYF